MVCCTTLWWDCTGKGRGWKTAAIIYCWQQQRVRGRTAQLSDISSGATCVADLDSRALALTKEASGNSRDMNFSMIQKCQSTLKSLLREIKTAEFVGLHRQNMDFWRISRQMHKKCATNYSHFLGADSSDAVRDLSNRSPSLIDHVCETCQHTPWFHTDICTSRQEW